MPIDFLGIGSKPEYYLSLTFFRRVMWLKQNWVAETGFIQGPDQRALSAPSGRPARCLCAQAQRVDGFRTDERRATEETSMASALCLPCGLCLVLR